MELKDKLTPEEIDNLIKLGEQGDKNPPREEAKPETENTFISPSTSVGKNPQP